MVPAGYPNIDAWLREVARATRDLGRLMRTARRAHAGSGRLIDDWQTTAILGAVGSAARDGDLTPEESVELLSDLGVAIAIAQMTPERATASAHVSLVLRAAVRAVDPAGRIGLAAWADILAAAHAVGIAALSAAQAAGSYPLGEAGGA